MFIIFRCSVNFNDLSSPYYILLWYSKTEVHALSTGLKLKPKQLLSVFDLENPFLTKNYLVDNFFENVDVGT